MNDNENEMFFGTIFAECHCKINGEERYFIGLYDYDVDSNGENFHFLGEISEILDNNLGLDNSNLENLINVEKNYMDVSVKNWGFGVMGKIADLTDKYLTEWIEKKYKDHGYLFVNVTYED